MKLAPAVFILLVCFFSACDDSKEKERKKNEYEVDTNLPPSGETLSAEEKKVRVEALITESKRTLDSIDVAYAFIRNEKFRLQPLSLDEREQVNEALIELNDTKDLIVLDMEQRIIRDLKAKTASLQLVMQDMNTKSEKLLRIAHTLSRISGVISKTTNLLAGALAVGIIRPGIQPAPGS